MKAFDPWTATFNDAVEASLYDENARRKWVAALHIKVKKSHFEQHPIDGVAHCLKACLSVPQWLSDAFLSMHEKFENLTVATLDEAFNHTPEKGKSLSNQRLEKQQRMNVQIAFIVAGGSPRTPAGRWDVAEKLGLTEKQVRNLLVKTRSNVKGHKPQKPRKRESDNTPSSFHDPFGLAKKVPRK